MASTASQIKHRSFGRQTELLGLTSQPASILMAVMRVFVVSAIFFGLAGCASSPEQANASRGKAPKAEVVVSNRAGEPPGARPVEALRGRVISVNPGLRFVVCDFPDQKLPQLDQRLAVYRSDEKVAEIKISGPYRGTIVVADITAGEAKYGDMVRPPR